MLSARVTTGFADGRSMTTTSPSIGTMPSLQFAGSSQNPLASLIQARALDAGVTHVENSEVLLEESVAVAVTNWPAPTAKNGIVARPAPSVVDRFRAEEHGALAVARRVARRVAEELDPERAQGVLVSVPCTPPLAGVSTGKFCRLFPPSSESSSSFALTPLPFRSMPSAAVAVDRVADDVVVRAG